MPSNSSQVDITFPFRIHGTLVGKRAERALCATYVHAHELTVTEPEETSVVLKAATAYDSRGLGDMSYPVRSIGEVKQRNFEIRRWNGRLFSRFCAVSELADRCGKAADNLDTSDYGLVHDTISLAGHRTPRKRLFKYMEDHIWDSVLYLGWMKRGDRRDDRIWVGRDDPIPRDRPPFHEWCDTVRSFDLDEMEELVRHYKTVADRLMVIGDHVWIEVRNPCIAVATVSDEASNDFVDISTTYIYHGVLPDLVTNDVSRRWFNLDQGEEALDCARRSSPSGSKVIDLRLPIECDPKEFAFDAVGERLWHVGYALALHCKEVAKNIPRKFSDHERSIIEEAYGEACKTNCVLRQRGNPESAILSLMPMSERTNFRSTLMTMGVPWEPWRRARLHDEVLNLLDNRVIDIYRLG